MSAEHAPDIRLEPTTKAELPVYKALYREAFPENERKPFSLIRRRAVQGRAAMLSLRVNGVFAGLVFMLLHGNYALIDYLAIDAKRRDQGLGTAALHLIRQRYAGCQLFLEVEEPETELQKRRFRFYLRNGMLPTGLHIELFGVNMQLLSDGGQKIPFPDYVALLCYTAGRYSRSHVKFLRQDPDSKENT